MVVGHVSVGDRVRKEVETLAGEFSGIFAIETIQSYAEEYARRFEDAPVTEFIPLLVYRSTREELRDQRAPIRPQAD